MSRKIYFAGVILFLLITLIVFGKSLHYDFLTSWDDDLFILHNSVIQELSASNIKSMFTKQQFGLMTPVLQLSLALDYQIYETEAWGFRLTNFILHALNMGLVFYMFRYFIDSRKHSQNVILIVGLAVTILWGIHPLRLESVVWLSQRRDVLSGFFCLLSMALYLSYSKTIAKGESHLITSDTSNLKWKRYLSILFFGIATLSKPSVVALPIVLVLLDLYPLQRLKLSKEMLDGLINSCFEKWEYFIVSAGASALTLFAHHEFKALHSLNEFSVEHRITNSIYSLGLYIVNTVCPAHLLPFYPRQELSIIDPLLLCTLILVGFAIYMLITRAPKKSRAQAIVIFGTFIAMLLPVLGFFQAGNQGAGDRFSYLATIPFFFCLGALLINKFKNRMIWSAVIIWALLLLVKTNQQLEIWKDSESFFTRLTTETPFYLAFVHNYLGAIALEKNETDAAILHFRNSLRSKGQNDQWAFAANNLGNIYNHRNNLESLDEAEYFYEKALSYVPDYNTYSNLAIVYMKSGTYDLAIEALKHTIKLAPDFSKAYHNLGFIYLTLKRYDEAEPMLLKALEISPEYELSHKMLERLKKERADESMK